MVTKQDDASAELLIREVDEELKQEEFLKLWKRYGNIIIGGAVAIVLGVAGWQGWQGWQAKQREQAGMRFTTALQTLAQGKADDFTRELGGIAQDGTTGYKLLAALKLAQMKEEAGDSAAAILQYDAVAAQSGIPASYRDLARLKSAYLKVATGDYASLEKAVGDLGAESNPWRHSAREILALAALKGGDTAKAKTLLAKVADDASAPQGLRARATEMLAALGGAQ